MSDIDPTKLKVVELRAELAARNLDTKGNKAVLVKRLKSALNKESGNEDVGGDDADVSMDADDSQITEDDSQIKDDSEENAGDLNDTGEDGTTKEDKMDDDADEKEDEENEEADQDLKDDDDDQDKSEDADLLDGDDVGPTEDQVVIDSVTDEEPTEKRPEKRRRSRSPTDKTRSRSRSPRRHHDRQRRSEDRRHRSRSRNRDHSSRHGHDRHHRSRSKSPAKIETEPEEPFDDTLIALDKYNSDLHLQIDKTRYSAEPLTTGAFAYMWAGARASYGVKTGKVCFETKVTKHLDVGHILSEEPNRNVLRVGFSVEAASIQLGEESLSYGYDGTGKSVTKCEFKEYGGEFGEGDVITSFLNMDTDPVEISFAKNGKHEGTAFEVPKEELGENVLYPHILTKNCSFEVNFGQKEEPHFPLPEGFEDFVFFNAVALEERERGTKAPEKREDCEIVMMCGLPGCGKTTWALKYASEHPEKKYNIIGTNSIIERMKVMGEARKKHYSAKWDGLIEKSTRCLNKLLDMGARTLRNFILDQTNVYASAQRRKMRPFEGFKRKAVVIVPTDEEYKRRCEKQEKEDGKDVSDHAVNEMKANFSLPQTETVFDDIVFVELDREESEPLVRKYSEEGRKALPPPQKRFRPNDRQRGPPPRGPPGRRGGSGGYRGPPSGGRGGAIPLRVSDNRNSRNKKGMYGGPRPRGPPGGGHGRRMRGPPGGGNRQRNRGYQGGGYNYGQGNWNQGGNWKSGGGYYGQQGGYGGGGGGGGGSYGYQQQHWNQPYYQQHQGYNQYYNQGGYGGGGGYHQGYGYGQK